MKRLILILSCLSFMYVANSQGVSVSYLIPKGGYISAPISPFSIRGLRIPITDFLGLQGGATLYNFPGLPIKDPLLDHNLPMRGYTFGLLVPVQLYIGGKLGGVSVIFSGGVFGLAFFNDRMIEGNLDRSVAKEMGWDVANTNAELKNRAGFGLLGGIEFEVPFNRDLSLTFGVNYLSGKADSPIEGTVRGGLLGQAVIEAPIQYSSAQTILEGLELSVGVSF
ncbi:MAG: hypothetical protein ACI9DM_001217 [Cyclobacteriaceae bacterium]|jgi:hypothetical protein